MKKIAVYNGSFDPVTNGHLDIIERAAKIFDILYVTVAIHPTKVGLFTIEQRKELLKKATAHLKNVIVDSTDELFMDYVKKVNGQVLIRGLRSTTDFDYELQYAQSNQYLNSQIEIMYLMTKPSHSFISSSVVKEIASYHKPLTGLVPECVEDALKKEGMELTEFSDFEPNPKYESVISKSLGDFFSPICSKIIE